jgi:hypothetical protein
VLGDIHGVWGWVAVGLSAIAGLWGIVLAIAKRPPGRWFRYAAAVAIVALIIQVLLGVGAMAAGSTPGNIHVFYGVVVAFVLAFAYIYRAQLAKRPALSWGLLLLFLMGLGIRGIMSFGQNFGG